MFERTIAYFLTQRQGYYFTKKTGKLFISTLVFYVLLLKLIASADNKKSS